MFLTRGMIGLSFVVLFPLRVFAQTIVLGEEAISPSLESPSSIPNPLIDAQGFLEDVTKSHQLRKTRRISEAQFMEMAKDPNTIILDARSPDRYKEMHISGAKSLSFTDFTEQSLGQFIPTKNTRILIYCNNNIANSPQAFPTKAVAASLNLSTYTALFTYGYTHVYELGPVIDPKTSAINFEGTLVKR